MALPPSCPSCFLSRNLFSPLPSSPLPSLLLWFGQTTIRLWCWKASPPQASTSVAGMGSVPRADKAVGLEIKCKGKTWMRLPLIMSKCVTYTHFCNDLHSWEMKQVSALSQWLSLFLLLSFNRYGICRALYIDRQASFYVGRMLEEVFWALRLLPDSSDSFTSVLKHLLCTCMCELC